MLVLFETPAGYALFKVNNEKKMSKVEDISAEFETPERASKAVSLQAFYRFADTTEVRACTCLPGVSCPRRPPAPFAAAPRPTTATERLALASSLQAVSAASALIESKLNSELKKFLKSNIVKKELKDELAVSDAKLGGIIKDKLDIPVRAPPFHRTPWRVYAIMTWRVMVVVAVCDEPLLFIAFRSSAGND